MSVRVLLDEQLPRQLAPYLVGARSLHGSTRGVGRPEERRAPEAIRDARIRDFYDCDQSLEFQQNLKHSGLFVIVLVAASNALEDLIPAVPTALAAMARPKAGQVVRVGS